MGDGCCWKTYKKRTGKSPFFMGKLTISMAIFNSYVSLPEGNHWVECQFSMKEFELGSDFSKGMEAGRLSWSNYISYPRIKSSFEKGFKVACSKGFFEHLWKSLVTCHCARLVAGLLLATSYALVIEDRSSNGWLRLSFSARMMSEVLMVQEYNWDMQLKARLMCTP
jgi:hypothetical protein